MRVLPRSVFSALIRSRVSSEKSSSLNQESPGFSSGEESNSVWCG